MTMMEVASRWANSDGFVVALVATLPILVVTLLFLLRSGGNKLPPGPKGWPIFGALLMLGTLPHSALYDLSKKYGPVMFLYLGSMKTLVVTSPQMSEEILKTHDQITSSRKRKVNSDIIFYDMRDMACVPCGPRWRRYRKICSMELLSAARVSQFQGMRAREVLTTLQFIQEEAQLGKVVNLTECFGALTTNNVTQMVMRKSYCDLRGISKLGTDSTDSAALLKTVEEVLELTGAFNISDYIPIIQPLDLQGLEKKTRAVHGKLDKFIQGVIDEHILKETSTGNSENLDFIDTLLAVGKKDLFEEALSADEIKALVNDVLVGAIDTTSVTSTWVFSELLRHPQVLSRVQEELDSVVGRDRLVKEADIPELKFLHAVVKETFRLHPPAPLLIPHYNESADCTIGGYHIPKGTQIFVNAWAIQRDPSVWERPLEFNPDRFLNSAIDFKGKNFEFLPFGSGRRMCPGMNLGVITVEYFLAQVLHAFSWGLPEDQRAEDLDMSEKFGIVLTRAIPLRALPKVRLSSHLLQ